MYNINRLEQDTHLQKYEKIWAVYEAKYNSMEMVQQNKQKRDEVYALKERSEWTKARHVLTLDECNL